MIVTLPLVMSLVVAAGVGARLLLAPSEPSKSTSSTLSLVVCWDGVERVRDECGLPR